MKRLRASPPAAFEQPFLISAGTGRKGTIIAVSLPNGAILSLATAYGAAVIVSGVTNASPAVATTATAHVIESGAFVEITSGWSKVNNRIVRAIDAAASALSYEGVDSTSASNYPAGSGAGSVREISEFTEINQVLSLTPSGGEMQFATYSFLDSDTQNQLPTEANAQSIVIEVADDATLPGYIALKQASESRMLTALKMTLKNGSIILYNGFVSLNETPTMTKGSVMAVKATLSLQNVPTRYAV